MNPIFEIFSFLSEKQKKQFNALRELYSELNEKINVISRKDIENINERHVLHSLFIHFVIEFKDGSEILDLGTGGGFPGIPLAILYPNVNFTLVDGTRKKITVAKEVINALGLKNATAKHKRAEEIKNQQFDFVVCRAVASVDKLLTWSRPLLKKKHQHGYPNGLLTWKGGDPNKEIKLLGKGEYTETFHLEQHTDNEYFKEKYILYVQG